MKNADKTRKIETSRFAFMQSPNFSSRVSKSNLGSFRNEIPKSARKSEDSRHAQEPHGVSRPGLQSTVLDIGEKKIAALSKKEVEIIAWLEFYQKYFFTINEIKHFFIDKSQRYNTIKALMKKKRIVKLNKEKYYLIPIKAKTGGWAEDPFIIADEIFNGENYFIGGWSAANYWGLTNQIPFLIEVFTTKRQGKKTILNTKFIFHRTTIEKIKKAVIRKINKHSFLIINRGQMKRWMKSRQSLL